MSTPCCPNELIEFDLNCFRVSSLRVLYEKNHEEGDDGRTCVDDKLPGIAKAKDWTRHSPDNDNDKGKSEGCGPAGIPCSGLGQGGVPVSS